MHRTLFITTDVPRDGGSGGQIASWRLLQTHAALGGVDLVATAPPGSEPTAELLALVDRCTLVELDAFYFANAMRALAKTFVRAQAVGVPYRVLKFSDRRMRDCIRAWVAEREYATVHCDFVSNWQYAEEVPAARRIVAHHNIEHQTYATLASTQHAPASWLLRREAIHAQRHELEVIRRADHTLVLSEADRAWIGAHGGDLLAAKVSVWPVPVDVGDVLPRPAGQRLLVLGSLRSIGRREGVRWLLREVWPRVRAARPDARLDIVGADPPPDLLAAHGRDGVTVHGFVEDLAQILAQTQACLIPLFSGGGIRVKIIECLGRGIPCVATTLGAQGMAHLSGVVVADTAAGWQAQLNRVLAPDGALREQAAEGRRELLATHTMQRSVDEMTSIVGLSLCP